MWSALLLWTLGAGATEPPPLPPPEDPTTEQAPAGVDAADMAESPEPAATPAARPVRTAQVLGPGSPPLALLEATRRTRHLSLPRRIAAISQSLLGRPYLDDPAGEGRGHDLDPPGRYDAFDCLTYVEEVLAYSLTADPSEAGRLRHALRYGDAEANYVDRRHFMELQWIPGAVEAGWLREITSSLGQTITLDKQVDDELWQRWRLRGRFAMSDDQLPHGTMHLSVLPLEQARAMASSIPTGSIVMTVRADLASVPIWVTHLGFVLEDESGTKVIRHASRMASALSVRDHDLAWYLRHLGTYVNWPTLGIAVFMPVEPGPRRSAVEGRAQIPASE